MTPRLSVAGAVAVGGIVGATTRWAILEAGPDPRPLWILVAVNALGCLIMGAATATPRWQRTPILTSGFCGGLTTFAAFALDTARLLDNNDLPGASAYVVVTTAAAVVALLVGRQLGNPKLGSPAGQPKNG